MGWLGNSLCDIVWYKTSYSILKAVYYFPLLVGSVSSLKSQLFKCISCTIYSLEDISASNFSIDDTFSSSQSLIQKWSVIFIGHTIALGKIDNWKYYLFKRFIYYLDFFILLDFSSYWMIYMKGKVK